jgi:hypothetical protein
MLRLIVCVPVVLALVGSLPAKDFWQEKPYTEWKKKEVVKMLLDSPWADAENVDIRGFGSPGISGAQKRYYLRFHSATPIRMAVARNAMLDGRADEKQAKQFIDAHPSPGYVVIGLSVATGQARAELARLTTEVLKQNAYLQLKGSGTRIYLERYESPSEAGGGDEAFLYFPRVVNGVDVFTVEEKEVRLNLELDPQTRINMPFKFKKMVFEGELEI